MWHWPRGRRRCRRAEAPEVGTHNKYGPACFDQSGNIILWGKERFSPKRLWNNWTSKYKNRPLILILPVNNS